MFALSYKYIKSKERKYLIIAISIFVLLTGCRYNVGQDYMLYMQTFLDSANDVNEFWVRNYAGTFELIFSAFIRLCNYFDLPYYSLFIFIAFIQIFFYSSTQNYREQLFHLLYFLHNMLFSRLNECHEAVLCIYDNLK